MLPLPILRAFIQCSWESLTDFISGVVPTTRERPAPSLAPPFLDEGFKVNLCFLDVREGFEGLPTGANRIFEALCARMKVDKNFDWGPGCWVGGEG